MHINTDLIDSNPISSRSHRYLRINLFFADLRPIPARLIEATIRESRSIKSSQCASKLDARGQCARFEL